MSDTLAREIIDFWIGDAAGGSRDALAQGFARWFKGGDEVDDEIRQRFGDAVEAAFAGGFGDWETNARARLSLVILLDQFPRNIFRGTALAFAGDARAAALARSAVVNGMLDLLGPVERLFMLMPYQHAERLDVQEDGVAQFRKLLASDVLPDVQKFLETTLDYAVQHRDIIARFGRFPYRNAVLGRESTAAEETWLKDGARFGQ